jgi:hypothetical protein
MNPRLVEPGFVVARLHVDSPARPGKDEYEDGDEAQRSRRHVREYDTGAAGLAQVRRPVCFLSRPFQEPAR